MKDRDFIYINKQREAGLREYRWNLNKSLFFTYTMLVWLFGIAVFIYIQYALYFSGPPTVCRNEAPKLYVWLIVEVIAFYVSGFLFLSFSSYYYIKK